MSDPSLINLVQSIRDSQSASIRMRTISGEVVHLDCVYKESVAPKFYLVFPPGKIPDKLDSSKVCSISIRSESAESIAFAAKISEISSDRSIELTAAKTIDPASLREYFRINMRTEIKLSYDAGTGSLRSRSWKLDGQTLDLSGSGVLGLFPDETQNINKIFIEIALTYPKKNIVCLGRVVRKRRIRRNAWHIALHFDDITQTNRDAIITNCLWEQRKQLRERIQTSD